MNDYFTYIFSGIAFVLFSTLVIPSLILAFYLKRKGTRAWGKIVSIVNLPGTQKHGAANKGQIIHVKNDEVDFTFQCNHNTIPTNLIGKVPVLYIQRRNKKPLCRIDSWEVMLSDSIIWFIVTMALVFVGFL